jgi:hypothetical protein
MRCFVVRRSESNLVPPVVVRSRDAPSKEAGPVSYPPVLSLELATPSDTHRIPVVVDRETWDACPLGTEVELSVIPLRRPAVGAPAEELRK